MSSEQTISIHLADENATSDFARQIAPFATSGDTLLLSGQIGSGKTTFARAFIRARLGADTEVPSPTFTLVQTYHDDETEIWHLDLYRLGDPGEIAELGLIDALDDAICLVEWPEMMSDMHLETAVTITFTPEGLGRSVLISGQNDRLTRLGLSDV